MFSTWEAARWDGAAPPGLALGPKHLTCSLGKDEASVLLALDVCTEARPSVQDSAGFKRIAVFCAEQIIEHNSSNPLGWRRAFRATSTTHVPRCRISTAAEHRYLHSPYQGLVLTIQLGPGAEVLSLSFVAPSAGRWGRCRVCSSPLRAASLRSFERFCAFFLTPKQFCNYSRLQKIIL